MKKVLIFLTAVVLVFTSCTSDIGNPVAACYEVKASSSESFAYYYFQLDKDGKFTMIETGGESGSTEHVIKGNYRFQFSSFNFIDGYGRMYFEPTEIPRDVIGLVFSEGLNEYEFYFSIDKNTGVRTMDLDPVTSSSKVLSKCFSIPDSQFAKILAHVGSN